jgi:hypothetical protein
VNIKGLTVYLFLITVGTTDVNDEAFDPKRGLEEVIY